MSDILEKQNRVIISLLARSAIGVKEIEKIVRSKKKKGSPDDFVKAYNLLDGTKNGVELAKIVGITQQSMASVLQTWENEGIVYQIDKTGRYVGLLKLPIKKRSGPDKKSENKQEEEQNGSQEEN